MISKLQIVYRHFGGGRGGKSPRPHTLFTPVYIFPVICKVHASTGLAIPCPVAKFRAQHNSS